MTRQSKTRRSAPRTDLTSRELLLAGIGAVSLGRKQAIQSYTDLVSGAIDLRARANTAAHQAGATVAKLRKQAEARVAPAQKRIVELADSARIEVQTRLAPVLAPVLAKFGVKPAKATARKPAKRPAKRARKAA